MMAREIRRVKIPPDAALDTTSNLRMIFEVLTEIAAQLADSNERAEKHDAELRSIMAHARAGQA